MTVDIKKIEDADWKIHNLEWSRNRSVYIGGDSFIDEYTYRHRAESERDWRQRKLMTYNPSSASAAIDKVMDTVTGGLWKVERTGHTDYIDWVQYNVGGVNVPMELYISTVLLPEYAIAGDTYTLIDAPVDAKGSPYCSIIPRENIKSVQFDSLGLHSILYIYFEEDTNNALGLVGGLTKNYMAWSKTNSGVMYSKFNENGKLTSTGILPLSRIPIVKSSIKKPLLTDISRMQVAQLNLGSSDVNFLTRSNTPIYVEQYDPKTEQWNKSFASVEHNGSQTAADLVTQGWNIDASGNLRQGTTTEKGSRVMGVGTGVRYPLGHEAPQFINPAPDCVKVSMEKQIEIVQEISRAINANLASITKGAVMQSAASKELDKDGEKAFSEYMSYVLKAFEEEVGSLFYEYKSITGKPTIIYPVFKDNTEEKEKIEDIKDGSAKKDPENMEGDTE